MTSGDTTAAANHAVAKAAVNPAAETVCVTGATGFIASWLVLRLLERGYTVRATVRDPGNQKKVKHLADLPHAKTRLTLWKADMATKGSYDEAIRGCTGVFHVASPMFLISDDPENEMIKPAVEGVLDIMRSCVESGTVRRLVFTSSAGTVNQEEIPRRVYDESCWTDVQYCRDKKMIGWIYFVSKTLAEQAAWEFAKQQTNLELVTIIPTIVLGPLLPPDMPSSLTAALSPITRNEEHYGIMRQAHLVHLDDLCMAHIFLYEHPKAAGRYICSSHDVTILQVADLLRHKYPYYHIPRQFEGVDEKTEVVAFRSKKLKDLGFEFKYSLEDMYSDAVQTFQDKGLLPRPHQN